MKIFFTYFLCLLLPVMASAQVNQKAEKNFISELNNILKGSTEQHWQYTGAMTIDSAFAINKNGILSVTVRYTKEDATFLRTRMEAPIKSIQLIGYDIYLILVYKKDAVTVYESEENSEALKETRKTNYFHIGVPVNDGMYQQEKLQKLLDDILQYAAK